MPVRKIPKNYVGVTGGFASAKNGRMVGFESLLERDFMLLLEFDPEVESFEEQPVRIPVKHKDRRAVPYVPDLLVHYRPSATGKQRKPLLAEVKKRSDLETNKDKYAAKFEAAAHFAAERGWEFRTVCDAEIRVPSLPNLKFLSEYRLISPEPNAAALVLDAIERTKSGTTVLSLLDRICQTDTERLMVIPVIWHLVATSSLSIDLNTPITDETVLALPTQRRRT